MADEDIQGPTTDTDTGAAEPQDNPAPWANYLEPLPDSVRPLVEPIFKKWDADTTQRFQKYSQDLEPYKAWDPVIQQFESPDLAAQAFTLMQAINEDPERVYQALVENYGFGDQGGQEPAPEDESYEGYVDPEFQTVKQMTEAMAEIMLQQQNDAQAAQEDAELDNYLGGLKARLGDFDDEYVLAHMHLGMDGEQAVAKYQQLTNTVRSQIAGPAAPTLLGSGGGLPSQALDPGKLNSKDTKNLVAQMLAAQADQT